jgi:hypothetical protein
MRFAFFLFVPICAGYLGCTSNRAPSPANAKTPQTAASSPSATPDSSSGVVTAALIVFEQPKPPFTIDSLMTTLKQRVPYACTRTQWVGFTTVIPQIRINSPTPIVLQINDDPEYVPDEIEELVPEAKNAFGQQVAARIARCRVRLEVMGVEPNQAAVRDKSVTVVATTQLDPSVAPVKDILKTVADTIHGYVFDTVHGKWQYAAP